MPVAPNKTSGGGAESSGAPRRRWNLTILASYFVAASVAAAILGTYFFSHVPNRRQYLIDLRFRTLAVVGGLIKGRVENLARAIRYVDSIEPGTATRYYGSLLPDFLVEPCGAAGRKPCQRVERQSGSTLRFSVKSGYSAEYPWNAILRDSTNLFARETEFRDFLVALQSGEVVFQLGQSTPRITQLAGLFGGKVSEPKPAAAEGGVLSSIGKAIKPQKQPEPPRVLSADGLPDVAQSISVTLDATPLRLLLQPINIEGGEHLPGMERVFVVGVVDQQKLERDAMYISPERVIWLTLPLAILFLLLPVWKLLTLKPRERYSFPDVVLAGASVLGFCVLAVLCAFHPAPSNPRTDENLRELAEQIETNVVGEFRQILGWLGSVERNRGRIEARLDDCLAGVQKYKLNPQSGNKDLTKRGCKLWEAIDALKPGGAKTQKGVKPPVPLALWDWNALTKDRLDVDVVFWSDGTGNQVRKWTTRNQLTGPVNSREQPYYRDVRAGRLLYLEGGEQGFVVQPLDSPTTAEMAFVFSVQASPAQEPDPYVLSVNVRPQSLVDVLFPPEYGFAVLSEDGTVLFHSIRERSLRENFFEETNRPAALRAAARQFQSSTLTADYRGREHRIHIRPLTKVKGSNWRLVVMRDLEPVLQFSTAQRRDAIAFLGFPWVVLLSLLGFAWWKWHRSTGKAANALMQFIWAEERRRRYYTIATVVLSGMAGGISLVFSAAQGRLRYEQTDVVLAASYALPFAAIAITLWLRRLEDSKVWRRLFAGPVAGGERHLNPAARLWRGVANRAVRLIETDFANGNQASVVYCLLALLVAILPAIGCLWVSYRIEDTERTRRWLSATAHDYGDRQLRLLAGRQQASHFSDETKKILAASAGPTLAARANYLHPLRDGRILDGEALNTYLSELTQHGQQQSNRRYRLFEQSNAARLLAGIQTRTLPRWRDRHLQLAALEPRRTKRPLTDRPDLFFWEDASGQERGGTPPNGPDALLLHWCELGPDGGDRTSFEWNRWLAASMIPPSMPAFSYGWGLVSLVLLAAAGLLVYFLVNQLFLGDLSLSRIQELARDGRDSPLLTDLISSGDRNVLLIGLPRSEKDRIVQGTIGGRSHLAPLRIRLQGAPLTEAWVAARLVDARDWMAELVESDPHAKCGWVHISNLEWGLNDQSGRRQLLALLEGIGEASHVREMRVRIVATSSLDPILHFNDTLSQEREDVYKDSFPELEMKRWALVLSKFDRCYVQRPESLGLARPKGKSGKLPFLPWQEELKQECSAHRELVRIGGQLAVEFAEHGRQFERRGKGGIPRELVRLRVAERAAAFYHLIWASCSRPEKLLLAQLAQTGVVNPRSSETMLELIRKGLVRMTPAPRIFNRTFHDYLKGVESPTVLAEWEREGGQGAWQHAARLALLLIGIGLLFFFFTQGASIEAILPLLTTSGLVTLPKLGQWLSRIASRGGGSGPSDIQAA